MLRVRSHIGIPGYESADRRATFESTLGSITGCQLEATEEGTREASRTIKKLARHRAVLRYDRKNRLHRLVVELID